MSELKVTSEFKEAFLAFLSEIPNMTVACKAMGVANATIDYHRKKDEEFDKGVREAIEQGYDMLEEEARRRAVDGVDKSIYFQGERVDTVKEYSDSLLMFLLKGYRRKRFGNRSQFEVDPGEGKVTMTFNVGGD